MVGVRQEVFLATYRLVLLIACMTLMAYGAFFASSTYAMHLGWDWFGFEQAAAVGCLASAAVPLLVYAKSQRLNDQILTIVQVALLLATAIVGFLEPLFLERKIWLFVGWYAIAALASTVLIRFTQRMAFKNGQRLSDGEIEELRERLQRTKLLEEFVMMQLNQVNSSDQMLVKALEEQLENIRMDRAARETFLIRHASIHPPPVFSGDH